jgi:hypothetical protein
MHANFHPANLTVVVNTCDAYKDVLEVFFSAFRRYWPDCPYPVLINTESSEPRYGVAVHRYKATDGYDDWGARLRATLNSLDTEFVLMVYDDFVLNTPVSNQRVAGALALLNSRPAAAAVYLINTKLPLDIDDANMDDEFVPVKSRADYRLNSAPAVWKRQALLDYTAAGDTPWAWEVFGTYRSWGDEKIFYSLNPASDAVYPYNHAKGGAIYRGKWVRDVVEEVMRIHPLNVDWNIRGFSSDAEFEKRPWSWKLNFIRTGFRMAGWKAVFFLRSYIVEKINANRKPSR